MTVEPLALPEVLLIKPSTFRDDRGHFLEMWRVAGYADPDAHLPEIDLRLFPLRTLIPHGRDRQGSAASRSSRMAHHALIDEPRNPLVPHRIAQIS